MLPLLHCPDCHCLRVVFSYSQEATMDDDLELLGSGVDPIAEQFDT